MDPVAVVLSLIAGMAIGWFARPYLVTRSEEQAKYDAIITNLDTIKAKVEVTERATVAIKTEFDELQWWKREYVSTRRNKLEELLNAAHGCQIVLGDAMIKSAGGESAPVER